MTLNLKSVLAAAAVGALTLAVTAGAHAGTTKMSRGPQANTVSAMRARPVPSTTE